MSVHTHGHRKFRSKTALALSLPSRHLRKMRTCLFGHSPHCLGRFWSTWAGDRKCKACSLYDNEARDLLTIKECLKINRICAAILKDEFNPHFVTA